MPAFINHEQLPLVLDQPVFGMLVVYAALALVGLITMKRRPGQSFLDISQTGQMRGLAILMIVCGHVNRISAGGVRVPNLAAFGVAVFLFSSGYGLAASTGEARPGFVEFFRKRLSRIFALYWLVAALAAVADYCVTGLHYGTAGAVGTVLGINFFHATDHIDSTRWFVTYIILMYVFFFAAVRPGGTPAARVRRLFGISLVFDLLVAAASGPLTQVMFMGMVRHLLMYSLVFPAGCLVYVYRDKIEAALRGIGRRRAAGPAVVAAIVMFAAKVLLAAPMAAVLNRESIGPVVVEAVLWQPVFAVFIAVLLVGASALARSGLSSGFLMFAGAVSYEMYLLHSVLMSRYDFFLFRTPFPVLFLVFLAALMGVGWGSKILIISFQNRSEKLR